MTNKKEDYSTCKHHKYSEYEEAHICHCVNSIFYTDATPDVLNCEEWKEIEI